MAKQIKDSQIIKVPDIVIDPQFFVPDDVIGVRPAEELEQVPNDPDLENLEIPFDDLYDENEDGTSYDDEATFSDDVTDDPDALDTPSGLTVLSQTVRMSTDGRAVVDVTFNVDDIIGATNYEIRVTV